MDYKDAFTEYIHWKCRHLWRKQRPINYFEKGRFPRNWNIPGHSFFVYFLINQGIVIYVGCTGNIRQRLNGHRNKTYDTVCVAPFIYQSDAYRQESSFIRELSPEYNIMSKGNWEGPLTMKDIIEKDYLINRYVKVRGRNYYVYQPRPF